MRLISAPQVKGWVTATLQLWLPYHLARAAEEAGLGCDEVPEPREWREPQTKTGLPTLNQTPLVVVTCPGLIVVERTAIDVDAAFEVLTDVLVRGQTFEQSALWAGVYEAAVRSALDQHRTLGGYAEETRWQSSEFDRAADDEQRTLGEALLMFHVYVASVHELYGVADEPPADPCEEELAGVVATSIINVALEEEG